LFKAQTRMIVAPNRYVPRHAPRECDIQHKIAFLGD
jgi:hypothetical protein